AVVSGGTPMDAFIRFRVQVPGQSNDRIWLNKEVWNSFINYYTGTLVEKGICYVDGSYSYISGKSPAKIRNSGDKAKLISSNDQEGFTYRGRFTSADQAVTIGYVSSQKVHNVLKWLIARQGARIGEDQYYLAWGTNNEHVPSVCVDSDDLGILDYSLTVSSTQEEFAVTLKKALAGYCSNLSDNSKIMIIGLDSATKGCLSVVYYKEYSGSGFIDNIVFWHSTCRWIMHKTVQETDGKSFRHYRFIGAPRPEDIIKAAYGGSASDALIESAIKRLVPCIIDKAPIPKDFVSCLVRRASSPVSMEDWEYKKVLAIACAVIKKNLNDRFNKFSNGNIRNYKEKWKMALDKQSTDRSYLFGRLLAYAQNVESYSMFVSGDTPRQTNAERMMHQFALKPVRTWRIISDQLVYYFKKIGVGGLTAKFQNEIAGIIDQIGEAGFDDRKLDDEYLLGYSSQMIEFDEEKAKAKEQKENN
ncbi:MAG: type I-C CRISPR-associated protein Cas8c/Csd1, partial [Candidatus Cloacimonetes bacterium]|nr:type I-C CRISPR-associated protein Cas8c/Csd1 [Candidatus Cloacimonadota bacterium]